MAYNRGISVATRSSVVRLGIMCPVLLVLAGLQANAVQSQESGELECGALANPVGPFSYYDRDPEAVRLLANVEYNHFNQDVRTLRGGQTSAGPMGDLDYVLRAFPNHPQALSLVIRFQGDGGSKGRFRTAACYLDRAIRLAPDDSAVRVMYGNYLAKHGQQEQALEQYDLAVSASPDYAEAHYDLGLLLVKLDRLPEARSHAERAYSLGYPLEGLRRQLAERGAWEPGE